jgi:D-alanyl-D-alanine carboxypeptidase (penicillin-binding protein 5/6)
VNLVAMVILSAYHLAGLSHGPLQAHLESTLQPAQSKIGIETPLATAATTMPVRKASEALSLGAAAVYAVDLASGTPLVSLNADKPLPIASLTKLATVLVLLDHHEIGETITVPTLPAYDPADALLHVHAGQQFSFENLLAASLIPSDNDAAEALALADSGTISAFSAKMNRLTDLWNIPGSHFASASGLVDAGNSATAADLAKLAQLGLRNSLFASLTATPSLQITDTAGQAYSLATTNKLLGTRTTGIKTGYTPAAGECYVGLATIQGHQVITVILGSTDRFGETSQLLDYIDRNYSWQ